jgi:lipoate-protein ligase A
VANPLAIGGDNRRTVLKFWDYTSHDFAENLAWDEWLLGSAAAASTSSSRGSRGELLRVWQPRQPAVVVGRGSRVQEEVDVAFCRQQEIPVFRRHSGGAAVVSGPGCWMYAVVLDLAHRPELRDLTQAHAYVMRRICSAAESLLTGTASVGAASVGAASAEAVEVQGICDLTIAGKKCSGNSLRVTREHLLYHGTLLVDFDLELLSTCLRTPPRQPAYRQQREHRSFVTNLPWDRQRDDLPSLWQRWVAALRSQWEIGAAAEDWQVTPEGHLAVSRLASDKYRCPEWTFTR